MRVMIEVTAAVIRKQGRVLICQRPEGKSCELLWEFPGGKLEPGESAADCIARECREELGVTLESAMPLTELAHEYPDRTVPLHFFLAGIGAQEPQRKEHRAFAWIAPGEEGNYAFCPADAAMLARIGLDRIIHLT